MTEVDQWLKSGAEVPEGLRLLNIYAPNPFLEKMVRRQPARWRKQLIQSLSHFASPGVEMPGTGNRSFREDWPFLSEPDCPIELKILAADKITAYRLFAEGHEELFSCVSREDCEKTAKKVIENYSKNRKIHSEFCFYRDNHRLLGKHPVFAEVKQIRALRSMSTRDLFRKRDNLRDAIWRLRKQIRSGNRPDLLAGREDLVRAKERQLDEINKLIIER